MSTDASPSPTLIVIRTADAVGPMPKAASLRSVPLRGLAEDAPGHISMSALVWTPVKTWTFAMTSSRSDSRERTRHHDVEVDRHSYPPTMIIQPSLVRT